MLKSTNVVQVLQPILIMCRVLGLLPFSIYERGLKTKIFFMVWTGVWLTIFMGLAVNACRKIANGAEENIKRTSGHVIGVITYLIIITCIFCGIAFKNKIRKTIKDIVQIDRQLKSDGLIDNVADSYYRNTILAYVSSFIIVIYSVSVSLLYSFNEKNLTSLVEILLPLLYTLLQFVALIFLIRERFSWINDKLQSLSCKLYFPEPTTDKSRVLSPLIASSFLQEKVLELIRSARLRHYQLCEISEQLNTAYSFQILLLFLIHSLKIIHIFYYQSKTGFTDGVLVDMNCLVCAIASIIIITIACSRTCAEAKKTASVIHDLLPCDARKLQLCKEELKYEVLQFSMQLLHHNVTFSPCNMFTIDESLLLRIMASLTTYLVIVIQFDISLRG